MDALMFVVILETSLLQFRILESCTLGDKTSTVEKLHKDRKLATDVLATVLVEVAETGQFNGLVRAVNLLGQKFAEPTKLRKEHEQLRRARSAIYRELKSKRNQWQNELKSTEEKITLMRDRKQDEILNAKVRLLYADKWLEARVELLEPPIQKPLPNLTHEERVHTEVSRSCDLQIEEREGSLEFWRQKYLDDTAKMNEMLAHKREQLLQTVVRREELQQLFNLHAGEIRAWLTFKRERAARLAREARVRTAATRVQAWWRGVMVRRALGLFKHLKSVKKPTAKGNKKK